MTSTMLRRRPEGRPRSFSPLHRKTTIPPIPTRSQIFRGSTRCSFFDGVAVGGCELGDLVAKLLVSNELSNELPEDRVGQHSHGRRRRAASLLGNGRRALLGQGEHPVHIFLGGEK